jgi:ElaB/YqjD/DUF883 family membrane-anchored ribosome-binding protein
VTTQQLRDDLAAVLRDVEVLMTAATEPGSDRLAEARARIRESVEAAKRRLGEAQSRVAQEGAEALHATDDYVKRNPWQAVGIAAGIGLIAGLLLSRR